MEAKVVKAPMPGKINAVLVEPGQKVTKGTPLVIMEAMKMETKVEAAVDGVVDEVVVTNGDIVAPAAILVRLK